MKKGNNSCATRRQRGRTATLDVQDLPAEVPLSPAEVKPNRLTGLVKLARGGRVNYLGALDTSLSQAIRLLIERSR